MLVINPDPPWWRVVLAFAVAPGVGALVMAAYSVAFDGHPQSSSVEWQLFLSYSAIVAYPTAIVFGVPAYIFGRRRPMRFEPTLWNMCLGGMAVAVAPWILVLAFGLLKNAGDIGSIARYLQFLPLRAAHLFLYLGLIAVWGAFTGVVLLDDGNADAARTRPAVATERI